jgi:hypothetical protein
VIILSAHASSIILVSTAPWAQITTMTLQSSTKSQLHTILSEKRLVGICLFIALAQFQYGYDSAAVSGFQSMPGFLAVFGYADVSNFELTLFSCDRGWRCKWMLAD